MSQTEILVRPARPRDYDYISRFTQRTFHWGDYIEHVWKAWVHDKNGSLLVAELDGCPVGMLHVGFLGRREAWMEGMRVQPDVRRRGIAGRLDHAAQAVARRRGCRVARLETALENTNAQSALARFGYKRVMTLESWQASLLNREEQQVRAARPGDLAAIVALWQNSHMARAMHGLMPLAGGWRWAEFSRNRLRDWLTRRRLWVYPASGPLRAFALTGEDEQELDIMLVGGKPRDAGQLLSELRSLAAAMGRRRLWLALPSDKRAGSLARSAGFERVGDDMLIYETPLR